MFDIGFPELLVISVVALLVIGPKQLPAAIRTLSLWIGRMQRSFANLRRELESEIGADEIRQQLHNEQVMSELKSAKTSVQDVATEINNTIHNAQGELSARGKVKTGANAKAAEKHFDKANDDAQPSQAQHIVNPYNDAQPSQEQHTANPDDHAQPSQAQQDYKTVKQESDQNERAIP